MPSDPDSIAKLLEIHESIQRELDDALESAEALLTHPGDLETQRWAESRWTALRSRTLEHIDEEEKNVFVRGAELGISRKQLEQFERAHGRLRTLAQELDAGTFVGASKAEALDLAEALDMFVHVYVTHADREERVFAAVRRVHLRPPSEVPAPS